MSGGICYYCAKANCNCVVPAQPTIKELQDQITLLKFELERQAKKADNLQALLNDSLQMEKNYSEGYATLQATAARRRIAICRLMSKGCDMIPAVSGNTCTAFLVACQDALDLLVDLDKEAIEAK